MDFGKRLRFTSYWNTWWNVQGTHHLQVHSKGSSSEEQNIINNVMLILLASDVQHVAHGGTSAPHTQATQSDLDSWWELNIQPQHLGKRTLVFIYSLVILSIKLCKVCYINLRLHGLLMHFLMWVSCDCVHRCEYERLNEVCVPKRESARGYYNIFRANFILSLHAFR